MTDFLIRLAIWSLLALPAIGWSLYAEGRILPGVWFWVIVIAGGAWRIKPHW